MGDWNDKQAGNTVLFTGTGEFQLRSTYAVARVSVRDGVVEQVDFSSENTEGTAVAEQISKLLTGQRLSQALEVKADQVEFSENSLPTQMKEAFLEAFHRAVEACFDSE